MNNYLLSFLLAVNFAQAGQNAHPTLIDSVNKGDKAAVAQALAGGADIEMRNNLGFTPLMLAVFHSQTDIVRLLVEEGAQINAVDTNRDTALTLAAKQNYSDALKILLDAGARVGSVNNQGWTALNLAAQRGGEAQKLLQKITFFLQDPSKFVSSTVALQDPLQELIWSIAYKKNQFYSAVKKQRADIFASPTVVARLFLTAAKTGNGFAIADLFNELKSKKLPPHQFKLICLQALKYLDRYPALESMRVQITGEGLH